MWEESTERCKEMTFNEIEPIEDCVNPDSFGELCLHCNKCGRFDEDKEGEDTE